MLLPVLEELGVIYFNANKGSWKIRHMWGQFKGLCEEEPGLLAVTSTAARSQNCDVMLTSPPCLGRTKQAALGLGGTSGSS